MKKQALFSSKDKSKKKIKCRRLQFLFGTLRVKEYMFWRRKKKHRKKQHKMDRPISKRCLVYLF